MRVKVTVVAGLQADLTAEVVTRMLSAHGRAAVLEHDITEIARGRVVRTVRDVGGSQHLVVDLSHSCLSCTLRESVLPALAECARHGRYDHVVLALPQGLEPQPVARTLLAGTFGATALPAFVDLHAVVTVVAPERLVRDAGSGDRLADHGLACARDDDRFLAEVLLRQIEQADVLIGPPVLGTGADLLAHLNPGALLLALHRAGAVLHGPRRHDARAAALRSEPGAVSVPAGSTRGRVGSLVWRARRPMHPQRLHGALENLVPAVVRTRGHVWLASQPDLRHALSIAGPRFDLLPAGTWPARDDARGTGSGSSAPAPDWGPALGDRGNELVLTGQDLDGGALHDLLDSTMLTEDEYVGGPGRWRTFPDPFAPPRLAAPRREPAASLAATPRS